MGAYVNPPRTTAPSKEAWLNEHGLVTNDPKITETELPVCLVDNGAFTAAGIAYTETELRRMQLPLDTRRKVWYQVKRELLYGVSDLADYEKLTQR